MPQTLVNCPHCGKTYQVQDNALGRKATCSACRKPFTLSAESSGSVQAGVPKVDTASHVAPSAGTTAGKSPAGQPRREVSGTADSGKQPGEPAVVQSPTNTDTPSPPPGQQPSTGSPGTVNLDRFEVIEELGAGAFGTVYKARDTQLDRLVALKIPRFGALGSEGAAHRFLREARAAGNLRHPNIVPIYDAGKVGESYFIASGFIEGQTLADLMDGDDKLSHVQSAVLIRKLAEALHYAHTKGIIHRDVKPANVMMDGDGEPLVMDFGMARRDEGEVLRTQEGARIGTPAYMSPEQHAGQSHLADARSDQWALGVMLYELLTGQRPFQAPNVLQVAYQVRETEPERPRKLDASISKDLETICLKCLEKEPEKRYASCHHLADELARSLRGEPIEARPIGRAERFGRWCKRNPGIAGLAMVAALLLLSVAIVSGIGYAVTSNALQDAQTARAAEREQREAAEGAAVREAARRQEAEAERDRVQRLQYASEIRAAHAFLLRSDREQTAGILASFGPKGSAHDARGWEWFWMQTALGRQTRDLQPRRTDIAIEVDSETGKRKLLDTIYQIGRAFDLAWSPDGSRFAISERNFVTVYDRAGQKERFRLDARRRDAAPEEKRHERLLAIAWSPDGTRIAAGSDWGSIHLWDLETREKVAVLEGHQGVVRCLKWNPLGRQIASGGEDAVVRVWDVTDRTVLHSFAHHESLTPPGNFASKVRPTGPPEYAESTRGTRSGGLLLSAWSTIGDVGVSTTPATPGKKSPLVGSNDEVNWTTALDWNPTGNSLVAGCRDGSSRVWEVVPEGSSGDPKAVLHHTRRPVISAGWHAREPWIVVSHVGEEAYVWDVESQSLLESLEVAAACWDAAGERMAMLRFPSEADLLRRSGPSMPGGELLAGFNAQLTTTDTETRRPDTTIWTRLKVDPRKSSGCRAVGWSPDGQTLAIVGPPDPSSNAKLSWNRVPEGHGGLVQFADVTDSFLRGHKGSVDCLAWHPDSELLASGGADTEVRIWNVGNRAQRRVLQQHKKPVVAVGWSPDGQWLFSAGGPDLVVWNTDTWTPQTTIQHGEPEPVAEDGKKAPPLVGYVEAAAWNPEGTQIAASHLRGIVKRFAAQNGSELGRLQLADDRSDGVGVFALAWHPSGNYLCFGGHEKKEPLWSWGPDSEGAIPLACPWDWVNAVAFSPDGTRIALCVGNRAESRRNRRGSSFCSLERLGEDSTERNDNAILVLDAQRFALLHRLIGHEGKIYAAAWSPNGERLATVSKDGTCMLWDPVTGAQVFSLRGHAASVCSVAWSPNGKTLATGGTDGRIKLWEADLNER